MPRLVSSITHAHIRSVIACFYYLEFARLLIKAMDKFEVYATLKKEIPAHLDALGISRDEVHHFKRLLSSDIFFIKENEIKSSGYVTETLEASIWCLLTTDSYASAVLNAVNLGEDTDTIAAVTGGLAGLHYGYEQIPKEWIDVLARKEDIEELGKRMALVI